MADLPELTYAQISFAAYANLSQNLDRGQYINALMAPAVGFTQQQAEQFVDTYRVLGQRTNLISGFSATVFQRIGDDNSRILAIRGTEPTPNDLISDLSIGLFGTVVLQPQYAALTTYLEDLTGDGGVLAGKTFSVAGHSLGGYLGAVLTGHETYQSQIQHVYAYNAPGTGGILLQWMNLLGLNVDSVNGAIIINSNAYNGLSVIAGFGAQSGVRKDIFIEADPNPLSFHNHSIVTLTDSLAMYNLFAKIDPTVSADLGKVTSILNAATSVYRGSLEQTLFDLRKLFQSPPGSLTPDTPLLQDSGQLEREAYYLNIATLNLFLASVPTGTLTVESLVGQSASAVTTLAQQPPEGLDPLAYRYALTHLNPFVIHGADYARHNTNGELTLFNPATGTGTLTTQYLTDRALFLAEKIALNVADATTSSGNIHFVDAASNYEIRTDSILTTDRQFLFGSASSETLTGNSADDRLYGGAGHDVVTGGSGADYIEGNAGDDTLTGGTGNDELWGGTGFDRYNWNTGDGNDRIEDSDATGVIFVNGQMLLGGVRKANQTYWENADGTIRYEMSGTDLVVKLNGTQILTVNENFESGQFGIRLINATSAPQDTGAPTGPFVFTVTLGPGDVNGSLPEGLNGSGAVYGNDLNNILDGSISLNDVFGDLLDGGAGNDSLIGRGGRDYLIGGAGNDYAYVGDGDVFLGGDDADIMAGSTRINNFTQYVIESGEHYADGGAGNDVLMGALGVDVLLGGEGDDQLWGENRSEGWIGQVADGQGAFVNVAQTAFVSATGAADILDGGAGNDYLRGDGGDDVLLGGIGVDTLYGDDETLDGVTPGDDLLDGGAGNDQLFGGGGSDRLLGGADNDTLFGDFLNDPIGANDWLDGGSGNDTLAGGQGDDVLVGGAGRDTLSGNEGEDVLDGGIGNDTLQGGAGGDVLWGGANNDRLAGDEGNDQLFGDDGADILTGGDGNDVLVGGAGTDTLIGGLGADTYIFNLGDGLSDGSGEGVESIQDTPGEGNKIVFGPGIDAEAIHVGVGSLLIRVGLTNDVIHILGFDPANPIVPVGIESFEFADGTILSQADLIAKGFDLVGTAGDDALDGGDLYRGIYGLAGNDFLIGGVIDNVLGGGEGNDRLFGGSGADILRGGSGIDVVLGEAGNDQLFGEAEADVMQGGDGDDVLNGDAGDDSLEGEAGDDVLAGGTGADQLYGGAGSDTYRFDLGDGFDSIFDSGPGSDIDRVVFGSGITSNSVGLSTSVGQIVIKVGAGSDGIRSGSVDDVFGSQTIEQFFFSDGTSLTYADFVARGFLIEGTEFDDFLTGTSLADRLQGGLGNDRLEGGEGNDSYFFDIGDGVDTISDTASVVTGNEVVFGVGITSTDLRLDLIPDQSHPNLSDLLIHVGTNGDAIQLDTFDRTDVFGPRTIETFRFADGSDLSYEQLLARGFDLTGTDGDDDMRGTNVADRMTAGGGADVVRAGLGDDQLDGGAGDDLLIGGQGNDAYLLGPGSGQDTIIDVQGSQDTIRFAAGAAPSDATVTRHQNDLVFSFNGGADRLTVSQHFLASLFQIEQVQFADGTIWDQAFLYTLVHPTIAGTEGPDVLVGTQNDDRIAGLASDDRLTGLAGNDLLDGGPGADQLTGGLGDDTYIVDDAGDGVTELENEGTDTVQAAVSYQLPAHVENLTLTGTSAIDGIGNALDNVLTGNSAANVLTGGAGNDTYVIGAGDTVIEAADEGIDTVVSATTATLGANLEHLTLTGNQPINGTGNTLNNILIGNQGINFLAGGMGDDTYIVGSEDFVLEQFDEGIDTIQSVATTVLGANVENVTLLGHDAVDAIGNELANVLTGNAGSNVLEGRGGTDRLDSGAGDDILLGGAGPDAYLFQRGVGQDVIQDTVFGELDTIQLGAGIAPSDIRVALNTSSELLLEIRGTSDRLTLRSYAPLNPDDQATKEVRFADGTVWDGATLASRIESAPGPNPGQFFQGTLGNDMLVGTGGDDFFEGLAGDDTLDGLGGNDVLKGYVGNDVLLGGDGNDTLYGEYTWVGNPTNVNDILRGGAGNDLLYGEIGDDLLDGGPGDDWLEGGEGVDTYMFGRGYGTDQVIAFGGVDRIVMNPDVSPADVIVSGGGLVLRIAGTSDQLFASLSPDDPFHRIGSVEFADGTVWTQAMLLDMTRTIRGTDLADELFGTSQANIFIGGLGDDSYVGVDATDTVIELANEGIDTIKTSLNYTLPDHFENLVLQSSASRGTGNHAANVITGTGLDNTLDGRDGNDTLIGGSVEVDEGGFVHGDGSDVLIGGAGDDRLIPSLGFREDGRDYLGQDVFGDDVLIGGPGNDVYVLYNAAMGSAGASLIARALLVEAADEGSDTVIAASDYTLGDNVENLTLVGDDSLVLRGTGNVDGNVLIGHAGVNLLEGLIGNDTLIGSGADDTLKGGAGNDTYLFNIGDGIDTIEDVSAVGEENRIQFGTGITRNDLTFTRDDVARTLTIQVGSSGTDKLILTNFDSTGANGSLVAETVAFADGSTTSLASLLGGPINQAPTVATPLADQIVPEGASINFTIPANTFADPDAGDTLTYSATLVDGTALPTWLSFDATTHTFTGTPDDAQVGSLNLLVTATDTGNLSVSDIFILTVTNVNEAPTLAALVADQTAAEDSPFSFTVPSATFADEDVIHGDGLTYSATRTDGSPLPSWLSFDATTRTFSGTPSPGDAGTLQIAITATDTGNLSATDQLALAISGPLPQTLVGTPGDDVLTGGRGDDTVTGLAGNDTLNGGQGHDLLDGGIGTDAMTGGTGHDTYIVEAAGDTVIEQANEGIDTVQSAVTWTLAANVENLTLTGATAIAGTGNSLNNLLTGNSGANLLDGGAGADTMAGGAGDDLYIVDSNGDVVIEQANEGTLDSVTSSATYSLSANVENLVLAGSAAINGTGNVLNNVLTGNSAANVLSGGSGNDIYIIGRGDTVVEQANEGTDSVLSAVSYQLSANVENLTLVGFSSASGTGNALDNVLNGLLNLGGNTLTGGVGNDSYIIGSGDTIVEWANGGADTVESLVTYTLGANLENLTLTGTSAVNGTGNALNNGLTGNSANNILSGANGNDTLRGGLGNDTVNGGGGNDAFLFGRGEGQDLVQDNSGTADRLLYDAGINPLDLVLSRQANNLRLSIHGSSDQVTIQNWYISSANQIETIQAGNGQILLNTQVNQLIQSMAGFTQQTGLSWDAAAGGAGDPAQQAQFQGILATNWQ